MSCCTKCGSTVLENASFCNNCGTAAEPSSNIGRGASGSKKMPVIAIVAIVIGGFFLGIMVLSIIATIAVPQLLDARRSTNQKGTAIALKSYAMEQESYKSKNAVYGNIEQIASQGGLNLAISKNGYEFYDLIVPPTSDFYAVLASPKTWGSSGRTHIIITSEGAIIECKQRELPFSIPLPANQSSLDQINALPKLNSAVNR